MQNDKPYPCRFCGELPVYAAKDMSYLNRGISCLICMKCENEANTFEVWQARNEKFNPFLEGEDGKK
jgi:hypothetical protein